MVVACSGSCDLIPDGMNGTFTVLGRCVSFFWKTTEFEVLAKRMSSPS